MKRKLISSDKELELYLDDIVECYKDNPQILDSQSPYCLTNKEGAMVFLSSYVNSKDSMVIGIVDDREEFLYGLILFDNIRMADKKSAECHIVASKQVWGKIILDIYKDALNSSVFDVLYCMIPANCVLAIRIAKQLGFKKTGYIPKVIPYINVKGIERLYDLQVYSREVR